MLPFTMSYKTQEFIWDIPLSKVQIGTPIGYEVEFSLKRSFSPILYRVTTYEELTDSVQGVFYYSLDGGLTWIDFPVGEQGQAFYSAYKMKVIVNSAETSYLFAEKHGTVYRIAGDVSRVIEQYLIDEFDGTSLDIDGHNNLYVAGQEKTLYKIDSSSKLKPGNNSLDIGTNPLGVLYDSARDSFWQIDRTYASLKDSSGNLIASIRLPIDIDVEWSSSSSSSDSSSSPSSNSSQSSASSVSSRSNSSNSSSSRSVSSNSSSSSSTSTSRSTWIRSSSSGSSKSSKSTSSSSWSRSESSSTSSSTMWRSSSSSSSSSTWLQPSSISSNSSSSSLDNIVIDYVSGLPAKVSPNGHVFYSFPKPTKRNNMIIVAMQNRVKNDPRSNYVLSATAYNAGGFTNPQTLSLVGRKRVEYTIAAQTVDYITEFWYFIPNVSSSANLDIHVAMSYGNLGLPVTGTAISLHNVAQEAPTSVTFDGGWSTDFFETVYVANPRTLLLDTISAETADLSTVVPPTCSGAGQVIKSSHIYTDATIGVDAVMVSAMLTNDAGFYTPQWNWPVAYWGGVVARIKPYGYV